MATNQVRMTVRLPKSLYKRLKGIKDELGSKSLNVAIADLIRWYEETKKPIQY